jgi:BirA family transcriptional regulator, biotin operon repressor / biotin---[acetyl-CoA-carboxylase] ligase
LQNISPKTLFTGHQLVFLPQCDSTNRIAQDLVNKNKATEGCVVITGCQTQGRGQRGNTWEAEPNQNVTLSVILKPGFLAVHQQFYLNICTSLAVLDLVRALLPEQAVDFKVKWPNDIYYGNKKLGGILIENTIRGQLIQHSILGIGLNINQVSFAQAGPVSLSLITGKRYSLKEVVEGLLERLEGRYLALKQGKLEQLKINYLQHLYRYQEEHFFRVADKVVSGLILGIDVQGRLSVQMGDQIRFFNFKEIAFMP